MHRGVRPCTVPGLLRARVGCGHPPCGPVRPPPRSRGLSPPRCALARDGHWQMYTTDARLSIVSRTSTPVMYALESGNGRWTSDNAAHRWAAAAHVARAGHVGRAGVRVGCQTRTSRLRSLEPRPYLETSTMAGHLRAARSRSPRSTVLLRQEYPPPPLPVAVALLQPPSGSGASPSSASSHATWAMLPTAVRPAWLSV